MALPRARGVVARLEEEPHVTPKHWNYGVLTPRPGRILRHDQCALCGLISCRPNQRSDEYARNNSSGLHRASYV